MELSGEKLNFLAQVTPGEYAIYRICGGTIEALRASPDLRWLYGPGSFADGERFSGNAIESVFAGDRPDLIRAIRFCVETQEPIDCHFRACRILHDFDWVHAKAVYCGEKDGCPVILATYVSDAVESDLYRNILDHSHDVIFVCDRRDYEILYANRKAKQLGGIGNSPYGCKCYRVIRGNDAPCGDCSMNETKSGEVRETERFNIRSGRWEHVTAEAINWFGHDAVIQQIHDITESKQNELRQMTRAETDALTGLNNRAGAERKIAEAMRKNSGRRCAFLMIDLDGLKGINDNLGHAEGDRALQAVADAMKEHFRSTDVLCRFGGDEFIAFLSDVSGTATLRNTLSTFMKRVTEHRIGENDYLEPHCSVGCAFGIAGRDSSKTLQANADRALYFVKKTGKNDFAFYVPEMEQKDYRYLPHSGITITHTEWYDEDEYRKLLTALAKIYPLVISVNLTKNSYYMMEYDRFATHRSPDLGCYDTLIETGAATFHPDDRQSFVDSFLRENLLRAYAEGREKVVQEGRQLGDDGVYRRIRTTAVFLIDEKTGDLCEISVSRPAD